MSPAELVGVLVGFIAVGLGACAVARSLRKRGYGEILDAAHKKALAIQQGVERAKAIGFRPMQSASSDLESK